MANDTKERILDAALEMFSQNGYAGINIRELSASLGFSKDAGRCQYILSRLGSDLFRGNDET